MQLIRDEISSAGDPLLPSCRRHEIEPFARRVFFFGSFSKLKLGSSTSFNQKGERTGATAGPTTETAIADRKRMLDSPARHGPRVVQRFCHGSAPRAPRTARQSDVWRVWFVSSGQVLWDFDRWTTL